MGLDESSLVLLDEIKNVFSSVSLDGGITLHQAAVIDLDSFPTKEVMEEARLKDTDEYWWEVRDEWIEASGVGGLHFLDDKGLRYYLPAYMSWYIRKGECSAADQLFYTLSKAGIAELFSREEKSIIAKFLLYAWNDPESNYDAEEAKEALNIWDDSKGIIGD